MAITTDSRSLALGFVFPFVCAAIVFSRFCMRRRRGVALLADDWLCLPAFVCVLGMCITIIYAVESHVLLNKNVPSKTQVTAKQRAFAQVTGITPILWLVGISCVKFSILLFYRRIFLGRVFNIISYTLLVLNGLWAIYACLSWLLYCGRHIYSNFEGSWKPCPEYGKSLQVGVYLWDAIIDFSLIVLPMPFIFKLQMAAQHKFELMIAFTVGGFAFIASLLNTTNQLISHLDDKKVHHDDPNSETSDLAHFYYWQAIELAVGLISCTLPTLQPLYNIVLVHAWLVASATQRSVASWRTHYRSALSSMHLSRQNGLPLSSSHPSSKHADSGKFPGGGGGASHHASARAVPCPSDEQHDSDVFSRPPTAFSPVRGSVGSQQHAPSESLERMMC